MLNPYVEKMNLRFEPADLEAGLRLVDRWIDDRNQVCVNSISGQVDPLYAQVGGPRERIEARCDRINPEFRGTIFEEILRKLQAPEGRARIMRLSPRACYSLHCDLTPRFHVALETNPDAFLYFQGHPPIHIPADGHVYRVNTTIRHTAFNAGSTPRYHMVMVDLRRRAEALASHPF